MKRERDRVREKEKDRDASATQSTQFKIEWLENIGAQKLHMGKMCTNRSVFCI